MREARIKVNRDDCSYYISNRLGNKWKNRTLDTADLEYAVKLLHNLTRFYLVDIISYCFLPDSIHIVAQMSQKDCSNNHVLKRYNSYYEGKKNPIAPNNAGKQKKIKANMLNISEFMRAFQQRLSQYLNKKYSIRGKNWSDRFRSIVIQNSVALWDCVKHLEQLPVKVNLVEKAESYIYSSWGEYCSNGIKNYIKNFLKCIRAIKQQPFFNVINIIEEYRADTGYTLATPVMQWEKGLICGTRRFIESFMTRKHYLPKYNDKYFLIVPRGGHLP